jgi:phage terminase large subunit
MESLFTVNKTDMTITATNGNQVLFLGLDSQDKIKSITFKTGILQAVWMEEANEFEEGDLMQLNLRLRGSSSIPFQITVSFNPVSAFHWLKSYFFDSGLDDCTILKTTYKDNKFIDDSYRTQLDNLTGTAKQVYALGDWGVTEGLVFKDFGKADIPTNARRFGMGLDFGFSSDPAALIDIWTRGDEIYLDERVYQTGLTNTDLSNEMKRIGVDRYAKIVADSAEPKSIEDLHRAGWNVHPAKKGPDSIRFGLDFMMSKKLFITPTSRNLLKEFYSYTWKQDKNGKWLPEPVDAFNHGIDAARYIMLDMARGLASLPTSRPAGI